VLPVNKQIIEVATEDEKYYMSFKSLKGAPDFSVINNGDKKHIVGLITTEKDLLIQDLLMSFLNCRL